MDKFKPLESSQAQLEVLGSRFIGILLPLPSIETVESFQVKIKKDYPKADHYPYAYVFHGQIKSSDDGEPGGSAGRPLLKGLTNSNLEDSILLAVRYFGGRKLGIPRLTRTFLSLGKATIENAKLGRIVHIHRYSLKTDYSKFEEIKKTASRSNVRIENVKFGEFVSFETVGNDTIILTLLRPFVDLEETKDLGEEENVEAI